jgi:hypothetical protein
MTDNTDLEPTPPDVFHLGEDFYAVQTEEQLGADNGLGFGPEPLSRTFELRRGDRTVCTKNDPKDGTLVEKCAAGLQEFFRPEILAELGDDEAHFTYLQKSVSVSQEVLPPWERIVACRTLNKALHTFTDDGNAFRFQDECGEYFIFDSFSNRWYVWSVNHFEPAEHKEILAARFVGRSVAAEEVSGLIPKAVPSRRNFTGM